MMGGALISLPAARRGLINTTATSPLYIYQVQLDGRPACTRQPMVLSSCCSCVVCPRPVSWFVVGYSCGAGDVACARQLVQQEEEFSSCVLLFVGMQVASAIWSLSQVCFGLCLSGPNACA